MKKFLQLSISGLTLAVFMLVLSSCVSIKPHNPTFSYYDNDDRTCDVEIKNPVEGTDTVTVPAEYEGKKVTSFFMQRKNFYDKPKTVNGIKVIILSEGIEAANINLLSYFPDLERIELPSTIKRIEGSLVSDVEIVFENNDYVELVSGCFIEKETQTVTGAKHYAEIPEGIKAIGENAFSNLNLNTIKLPESLEKIEERAFINVSIDEPIDLTFEPNIKYVDRSAFYAPITIKNLTISTRGALSMDIFGSSSNGATINNIILNEKPNIVAYIDNNMEENRADIEFNINGDKNGDGVLRYLYIKKSIDSIPQPIMFGEVESDMEEYKKYDFTQYQNESGYTIILFIFPM